MPERQKRPWTKILGQKTTKTQIITKMTTTKEGGGDEENAEMNSISHKTKQKDEKWKKWRRKMKKKERKKKKKKKRENEKTMLCTQKTRKKTCTVNPYIPDFF